MVEIQNKCGAKPNDKPLYKEKTIAKEVSKLRSKKKIKRTTR